MDDPSKDLSKLLLDRSYNGRVLITTRNNRVASRLAKRVEPIILQLMSHEEAKLLFRSKLEGDESDFDGAETKVLLEERDYFPLAMS